MDFKEDVGVNFVIWLRCFPYTKTAKGLARVVASKAGCSWDWCHIIDSLIPAPVHTLKIEW